VRGAISDGRPYRDNNRIGLSLSGLEVGIQDTDRQRQPLMVNGMAMVASKSRRFLIIPGPARCQCDGSLQIGIVVCSPSIVRSSEH